MQQQTAALLLAGVGVVLIFQDKLRNLFSSSSKENPIADLPPLEQLRLNLESVIFQETGRRVSLKGDSEAAIRNNYVIELAKAGLNPVDPSPPYRPPNTEPQFSRGQLVVTRDGFHGPVTSSRWSGQWWEYRVGSGSSWIPEGSLSRYQGPPTGANPKFSLNQAVLYRGNRHLVTDIRWNMTLQVYTYQLDNSATIWAQEPLLTGAPTVPAPEVPAGLVVGSKVKVRTNIGEKQGTITNIRYDSQRRAHRYSVRDDAGNTFEYSESQLTLIAGGENTSGAKFKIGDQVQTSGGRTGTIATVGRSNQGYWEYTLAGHPFTSYQESLLTRL